MNEGKKKLKDNLYFIYTFIAFFVALCFCVVGLMTEMNIFYLFGAIFLFLSIFTNKIAYTKHGDPRSED